MLPIIGTLLAMLLAALVTTLLNPAIGALPVAAMTKEEDANVTPPLTPATELKLTLPLTARAGPVLAAALCDSAETTSLTPTTGALAVPATTTEEDANVAPALTSATELMLALPLIAMNGFEV